MNRGIWECNWSAPSGDYGGRDKARHGRKATMQEVLTSWRLERRDRTQKESNGVRGTHPQRSGCGTKVTDDGHPLGTAEGLVWTWKEVTKRGV